jgi:hypothetical protein
MLGKRGGLMVGKKGMVNGGEKGRVNGGRKWLDFNTTTPRYSSY